MRTDRRMYGMGLGALVLGLAGLLAALPARAQAPQLTAESSRVAFYRFVGVGQPSIRVDVWGDVGQPGVYQIEAGTDLQELLFLAGGPAVRVANSRERRVSRVLLYRRSGDDWQPTFDATLDDVMGRAVTVPALADGDVARIHTEVRQRFSWRDVASLVGSASSVALLVWRITR